MLVMDYLAIALQVYGVLKNNWWNKVDRLKIVCKSKL